jgi:hypothetical protein
MHSSAAVVAYAVALEDEAQVPDSCSVTRVESARFKESGSSWLLLSTSAGWHSCVVRFASRRWRARACAPIMRPAASHFLFIELLVILKLY